MGVIIYLWIKLIIRLPITWARLDCQMPGTVFRNIQGKICHTYKYPNEMIQCEDYIEMSEYSHFLK